MCDKAVTAGAASGPEPTIFATDPEKCYKKTWLMSVRRCGTPVGFVPEVCKYFLNVLATILTTRSCGRITAGQSGTKCVSTASSSVRKTRLALTDRESIGFNALVASGTMFLDASYSTGTSTPIEYVRWTR